MHYLSACKGPFQYKYGILPLKELPVIKVIRSRERPIFIIEIPIPDWRVLILKWDPELSWNIRIIHLHCCYNKTVLLDKGLATLSGYCHSCGWPCNARGWDIIRRSIDLVLQQYPCCTTKKGLINSITVHYCDVIMGSITSQITSLTIVYLIVHSSADQRKHQSSASLAFVRGIHRRPGNSPHKWPVTRKMSPFEDVITRHQTASLWSWTVKCGRYKF